MTQDKIEEFNRLSDEYRTFVTEKLSVDFFFRDTIIHQATFIKKSVFNEFPYDENLRVTSDRKLWLQCLLAGKEFVHLPFRVCLFDLSGIGTSGKLKFEEEIVKNQLFPVAVHNSI